MKSKRLSSTSEDESDAETLDATIDDDAGYSLNSRGSGSKTAAAYTQQARKKSGKLLLDDAASAPASESPSKDVSGQKARTVNFK